MGQSVGHATFNTTRRDSEQPSVSKISSRPRSSVQKRRDVQCRQNEISQQQKNSSRAILTQIGQRSPVGWKPRARQQFSTSKTRICSSRTVARQFQLNAGMPPFGWRPRAKSSSFQRRQSDSSQQQNSSRAVSNQIGHAPVRLEAATTESREVRVPHTSHLTRPTEIQNDLALAKPAADRAVPCRKSAIS